MVHIYNRLIFLFIYFIKREFCSLTDVGLPDNEEEEVEHSLKKFSAAKCFTGFSVHVYNTTATVSLSFTEFGFLLYKHLDAVKRCGDDCVHFV